MTSQQGAAGPALRFGSVPYLNARPLLAGLGNHGSVRLEVPSRLVPLLAAGELDVALTPIVAAFDHPGLVLVPVGAVSADGPVESVLLFCRGRPEDARTVALDTSSRTSADLVRVLCRERWGCRPRFSMRDPDPDLENTPADAVLLIGDPALQARWRGPPPVDLAAVWRDWTGLPFVFAAWLARNGAAARAAESPLRAAAERGRAELRRIALAGAAELGLDPDRTVSYMTERLRYTFGDRERRAIARFRELRSAVVGRAPQEG